MNENRNKPGCQAGGNDATEREHSAADRERRPAEPLRRAPDEAEALRQATEHSPLRPDANRAVSRITHTPPSDTDPDGSYTGKPIDQWEVPVQDVDDL